MLYRASLCFSIALAVAVGCNTAPDLPTVPVTGTITMNGEPVAGAQVVFLQKPGTMEGKPASGVTDDEGKFTLKTYLNPKQSPEGALPGEYDVTVTRIVGPPAPTGPGGAGDLMNFGKMAEGKEKSMLDEKTAKANVDSGKTGPEAAKGMDSMYGIQAAKNTLPGRYANQGESGLTATVKEGGQEPFAFDLTE